MSRVSSAALAAHTGVIVLESNEVNRMEMFDEAFDIGAVLFEQVKAVTLGYRIPALRLCGADVAVSPLRLR